MTPYQDHRMGGHWERHLDTPDFAGFCKYIVEFCTDSRPTKNYRPNDGDQRGYGFGYLAFEAKDPRIPARPIVKLLGWDEQRPRFSVSPFASESAKFAALEWRIAEISAPGVKGYVPGKPFRYEIERGWTTELTRASPELLAPSEACVTEKTYRVRARYKDDTGRCSRWSEPVQFVSPGR